MNGFIFPYRSKILNKRQINHNIICYHIEKPWGYRFESGQAIDLSIDCPGYELQVAPFTITTESDSPFLELFIKLNPFKNSVSGGLASLENEVALQITAPWDTFQFKGNGVFIAAGTGIMPFLPIFKKLADSDNLLKNQTLFYANKRKEDILFNSELNQLLGKNYINILSEEKIGKILAGRIDFTFLKKRIKILNQYFYICGPQKFEKDIKKHLRQLGVKPRYIQTGFKL